MDLGGGWYLTCTAKRRIVEDMRKHATTARLEARLPSEVHILLKRAAEIQGRTLTDFVVSAASDAARSAIENAEIIRLSIEGQRQMAEALLDPPQPSLALRSAAQHHRDLFGSGASTGPRLSSPPPRSRGKKKHGSGSK